MSFSWNSFYLSGYNTGANFSGIQKSTPLHWIITGLKYDSNTITPSNYWCFTGISIGGSGNITTQSGFFGWDADNDYWTSVLNFPTAAKYGTGIIELYWNSGITGSTGFTLSSGFEVTVNVKEESWNKISSSDGVVNTADTEHTHLGLAPGGATQLDMLTDVAVDAAISYTVGKVLRADGNSYEESYLGITDIPNLPELSGDYLTTSGDYASVSGDYVQVSGDFSEVSGAFSGVSGDVVELMNYASISGDFADLSGDFSNLSGDYVNVSGDFVTVSGSYVLVSGSFVGTSGDYVIVSGDFVNVSGSFSNVSGDYVIVSGSYVGTSGDYVITSGDYVITSGDYVTFSGDMVGAGFGVLSGDFSDVSGDYVITSGDYAALSGDYTTRTFGTLHITGLTGDSWQVFYSSGIYVTGLDLGTTGQALMSEGTGVPPVWTSIPPGGVEVGAAFPVAPTDGDLFYDTGDEAVYMWSDDAAAWIQVGGAGRNVDYDKDLMIGAANAADVPLAIETRSDGYGFCYLGNWVNASANNAGFSASLLLPTNRGGKKLYIKNWRVGLNAADANDYVDQTDMYGVDHDTRDVLATDLTNYNSPAEPDNPWTYTPGAAIDCSGYDKVGLLFSCVNAAFNNLVFYFVTMSCYYDD